MNHELRIEKTKKSRIAEVDFEKLQFGKVFSDHMFIADFSNGEWHDLRIVPFGNLSLHPATTSMHYGQIIFEGMKAYRSIKNIPQLFRPLKNIQRMNQSAHRMAMAELPEEMFLNALTELISLDREWIPKIPGGSLYIRPLMFATDEYIGIRPAENFKFLIMTSPVLAYYERPVKVWIEDKYVRAFKGGVGAAKVAGNYGATLYPLKLARQKGYDQILWLDGANFKYVHEIGTMNVFFGINGKYITPTLEDGTILDGVTRDSMIQLLHKRGIVVEERRISIDEVIDAHKNGLLDDAFGTGTAATISHISDFYFKGENIVLPPVEKRRISLEVKQELDDIKVSKAPDLFNWMYKVEAVAVPANKG